MKYSFTAITFAFLALTLHASPVQLQNRDMATIEESNITDTTMPGMQATPVPTADAPPISADAPTSPAGTPPPPAEAPPISADAPTSPAGTPPPPAEAPPADAPAPLTGATITDAAGAANMTSSSNSTTSSTSSGTTNTPGTVLPGTATNCSMFYTVVMGDTCHGVGAKNGGVTFDVLKSLNTGIDPTCSNLVVGQSLCVKA